MHPKTRNIFYTAVLISLLVAIFLFAESWAIGKRAFFLMLNTDIGPLADQVFKWWTLIGDGIIWVPVVILIFLFRKQYLLMVVLAIVISTLITQGTKHLLFEGDPRPTYGITDLKDIHTVPGVELNTVNSFPSGHTGTAFTVFLLLCLVIKRWWVVPAGFVYACGVGYSRIYLAQHFPLDVAGGIITGIITISLCLLIQRRWSAVRI